MNLVVDGMKHLIERQKEASYKKTKMCRVLEKKNKTFVLGKRKGIRLKRWKNIVVQFVAFLFFFYFFFFLIIFYFLKKIFGIEVFLLL